MENASKALLIAGSILIAILLIAAGVKIFNSTSGTTDTVEGTMQTTEISMFNNKFLPYIGKNKTKTDAINLLNIINAHNAVSDRDISIWVEKRLVGDGNETSNINAAIEAISSNVDFATKIHIYVIERENYKGYIQHIQIARQ